MVEGQEKQLPAVGSYYMSSAALWPSQADASALAFRSLKCSQGYTSREQLSAITITVQKPGRSSGMIILAIMRCISCFQEHFNDISKKRELGILEN